MEMAMAAVNKRVEQCNVKERKDERERGREMERKREK